MSQNNNSQVEMAVVGIFMDPATQAPVILLRSVEGDRQMPIWIGMAEATAIASHLKKLTLSRPLTHDIFVTLIKEMNGVVEQAVITELRDSTYLAEIVISAGERAVVIDCRPSDAVAIALKTNAPIYVEEKVLKAAEQMLPVKKVPEGAEEPSEPEAENQSPEDLRYIDKSKWAEILKELDVKDFKYKA